jgi:hypothetical protein
MGGGVLKGFYLVPPATDDATIFNDDAAAGDFAGSAGFISLAHCQQHILLVFRHAE